MKGKSQVADIDRSVYDIRDKEDDAYRMQEGLTPEIIDKLSKEKDDPVWMQQFRLQSLQIYNEMPVPGLGPVHRGAGHGSHCDLCSPQGRHEKRLEGRPAGY